MSLFRFNFKYDSHFMFVSFSVLLSITINNLAIKHYLIATIVPI